MFKFHLLRTGRDLISHLILILLPIIIISFLSFVFTSDILNMGAGAGRNQLITSLAIGMALTFQIYGASLSVETLGQDLLTPMHNRLLATPFNPRKIVLSVVSTSIIVSYLQTVVIILFSIIILGAKYMNLVPILIVLLVSVIFNQLLGVVILFLMKKTATTLAITSLYASLAPMIAGLYFPLPDTKLFNILRNYSNPMSLAHTAIRGIMEQDIQQILIGVTPLLVLIVILYAVLKPLSKKVIL